MMSATAYSEAQSLHLYRIQYEGYQLKCFCDSEMQLNALLFIYWVVSAQVLLIRRESHSVWKQKQQCM